MITSTASLRVLLIDDDAVDRQAVRRALQKIGDMPAITEAVDSRSAYHVLSDQTFDCILLDYRLPDADGLAVVRELRRRGLITPIIVLTGQSDTQVAVDLMKAGATDYIVKASLHPEHLDHSVRTAIRLQHAEMQSAKLLQESLNRLRFLTDVGRELSSSLELHILMERLSQLIVGQMADWCAIDVLEIDEGFRRCAVVNQAVDKHWGAHIDAIWPFHADSGPGVSTVVDARTALVMPLPNRDMRPIEMGSLNDRLSSGEVGALVCLPIISGDRVYGGLSLVRRAPAQPYSVSDVALLHQISERLGAALENARLYQMAREAIRLRDDFLSIASHELRTPLTSMLGYVQLLERNLTRHYELSEREVRALSTLTEQTRRLNTLIAAMLDVSRLQNGQLSLSRTRIDLSALVKRTVDETNLTLDSHALSLITPSTPVWLSGDEVRLQQMLLNLLSNAIKYSPKGGTVKVRLEEEGGWAHLTISDEGIGIPREALDLLFSRFFRAANANEGRISGIGLGLYVVHEIVMLHGGNISVDSQVGMGSTFVVKLPLAM